MIVTNRISARDMLFNMLLENQQAIDIMSVTMGKTTKILLLLGWDRKRIFGLYMWKKIRLQLNIR